MVETDETNIQDIKTYSCTCRDQERYIVGRYYNEKPACENGTSKVLSLTANSGYKKVTCLRYEIESLYWPNDDRTECLNSTSTKRTVNRIENCLLHKLNERQCYQCMHGYVLDVDELHCLKLVDNRVLPVLPDVAICYGKESDIYQVNFYSILKNNS